MVVIKNAARQVKKLPAKKSDRYTASGRNFPTAGIAARASGISPTRNAAVNVGATQGVTLDAVGWIELFAVVLAVHGRIFLGAG